MEKRLKKILNAVLISGLLALPVVIMAGTPDTPPTRTWDQIKTFITGALYTVGGVAVAAMALYAGILFITSGGDPEKATKARQAFVYTAIGAAVLIIAVSVWTIIKTWL